MNKIDALEKRIIGLEARLNKVKQLYDKTVSYSDTDPIVSLQQARLAAEAICKQVLSYENGSEIGNMMLEQMIASIMSKNIIPKKMVLHVKSIQHFGNYGSHYQTDEVDEISSDFIQPCLNSLSILVNWYFNEYLHVENQVEISKSTNLKKFSLDLKRKLIEETQLERLSFGLSLSTDDERMIDMDHYYESITRIDYMDYEGNKANSYRWLRVKNVSKYPTMGIYHMECGENKITFKQFAIRANKACPTGKKLKVESLVDLQPSFVQKVCIYFDHPLLPEESYELFYRISWHGELQSYSQVALSQSISLARYYQGVARLKYGLLEKYEIDNVIAEKTNKYFEQVNVQEVPIWFSVEEEEALAPLHASGQKGFYYIFDNPDGHAYRFKYKLEEIEEDEDEFEF